jgi:hypothetical protein
MKAVIWNNNHHYYIVLVNNTIVRSFCKGKNDEILIYVKLINWLINKVTK